MLNMSVLGPLGCQWN